MNLTRRELVKESMVALGFLALPGTPMFAAPVGSCPPRGVQGEPFRGAGRLKVCVNG